MGNPGSFPGIHPGVVALLLAAKCSDLNRAACVIVLRKFNSNQKDRLKAEATEQEVIATYCLNALSMWSPGLLTAESSWQQTELVAF